MTDVLFHPRVLELMASRVCHDLVSPVGAIGNGVELMEEMGADAGDEAMRLIANSARQASIRLKAFRLCYGAAGTDMNIGFKDVNDAFVDLVPSGGRIVLDMAQDIALTFSMPPRGFFKTFLNLLILAEECLHGEGRLSARVLADKGGIEIEVLSKNAGFRANAETALKGDMAADDLDARSVHAYLTGRFAESFGFGLSWLKKDDAALVFSLRLPE